MDWDDVEGNLSPLCLLLIVSVLRPDPGPRTPRRGEGPAPSWGLWVEGRSAQLPLLAPPSDWPGLVATGNGSQSLASVMLRQQAAVVGKAQWVVSVGAGQRLGEGGVSQSVALVEVGQRTAVVTRSQRVVLVQLGQGLAVIARSQWVSPVEVGQPLASVARRRRGVGPGQRSAEVGRSQ